MLAQHVTGPALGRIDLRFKERPKGPESTSTTPFLKQVDKFTARMRLDDRAHRVDALGPAAQGPLGAGKGGGLGPGLHSLGAGEYDDPAAALLDHGGRQAARQPQGGRVAQGGLAVPGVGVPCTRV